ncbi:MAG: phosphoribosyltransferase [Anaerolineaceae bacterium]|nr:phosphoribosyltransferase [Anaerolineaceae bacterium]
MFGLDKESPAIFRDRADAGQQLAEALAEYEDRADVVVLGLPRGGVPVAYEVARALDAPLDVFIVRKLGVPGHEELAMGAIASGGVRVINQDVTRELGLAQEAIEAVARKEGQELARREEAFRNGRSGINLHGKVAILVDDGIATGASMRAAVKGLRQHNPAKIIVAAPVASAEACRNFEALVDEVVCLQQPRPFLGVGAWFESFAQTTNDEVRALLEKATAFGEPVA